jgi:protein-S-isoprenylcysteine O-methyltransferase Ste14
VVAEIQAELFMAHYHVRALGYAGFFLLLGLIVAGFVTGRTRLATLGGVGVMLACFAQFASVMFFLAGLGALNALWLPILDISWGLQDLGLVINSPDHFLRWLLGLVGVHSLWPRAMFFIAVGIFLFLFGVYAWLKNRAEGDGVADFWIYRISRHPQYLGWIIWTYGAYVLIQRMHYPRRSWGIGASLPWLISTMVIVGVAMLEELHMRSKHGEAYESYRKRAPFLFPVPRVLDRIFSAPLRWFHGKEQPERRREVATVVVFYTVLLMVLSSVFYDGGLEKAVWMLSSRERKEARVEELVREVREGTNWRRQSRLAGELGSLGEMGAVPLISFLEGEEVGLKVLAAETLERHPSVGALPALGRALSDSVENVRYRSAIALDVLRSPEAIPYLLPLLDDPVGHVRLTAFRALANLGAGEVMERAPALIESEDGRARAAVVDALGTLGWEAAIPLLAECMADSSAWVRTRTVVALLRIGSPEGLPFLEEARDDEDWEVRVYAAEAAERLGG